MVPCKAWYGLDGQPIYRRCPLSREHQVGIVASALVRIRKQTQQSHRTPREEPSRGNPREETLGEPKEGGGDPMEKTGQIAETRPRQEIRQ
jgi:hypothetical protein